MPPRYRLLSDVNAVEVKTGKHVILPKFPVLQYAAGDRQVDKLVICDGRRFIVSQKLLYQKSEYI